MRVIEEVFAILGASIFSAIVMLCIIAVIVKGGR